MSTTEYCSLTPPEKLNYLTIETSTWCNLACMGCSRTILMKEKNWRNRYMSANEFSNILTNLPSAHAVTLNGVGEPTLNPDIIEITRMAAESGKFGELTLVTNGLHKSQAIYAQLLNAGLTRLHLSIDSFNKHIIDKVRRGTRLESLENTLAGLIDEGTEVTINIVASQFNLSDIPDTLDRLNKMGRLKVLIQAFIDFGAPEGTLSSNDLEHLRSRINPDFWPNLDIQLHGLANAEPEDVCTSPWNSLAVTIEGFLTPCCVTFNPLILGRSSLEKQSFEQIWRSEVMQNFLKSYIQQAPAFCRGCTMNKRATPSEPFSRREFEVINIDATGQDKFLSIES